MAGVRTRIKFRGKKVTLRGVGFGRYQNLILAQTGLRSIKRRVSNGVGAYDTPMPPLKDKYAIAKGTRLRNLWLTGAMLAAFTVRWASNNQVATNVSSRLGRVKALANQKKFWWMAYSPQDQRLIMRKARKLFKAEVAGFNAALGGRRSYRPGQRRAT